MQQTEVIQKYTRFKDALWFKSMIETPVLLCGQGGIGSWTALALASAGCEQLVIIDYDEIEEHNLAGQFFKKSQVGQPKVRAVFDNVKDFSDTEITFINNIIEEDSDISDFPIIITGFDKMKPRKITFEKWKENVSKLSDENKENALFIDGRLTAEQIQIFSIRGNDEAAMDEYLTNHIFDDSVIEDAPCTFKQTRFLAMEIAGIITSIYCNHLVNISTNGQLSVPFFYEVYTPLQMTKKINRVVVDDQKV